MTNDGRNRTPNSRKNSEVLEKRKLTSNLGIFEADTIKQAEMKEKKLKKNNSEERENNSKPNYIAEISP